MKGQNGDSEPEDSSNIFQANTDGGALRLTDIWSFIVFGLWERIKGMDMALNCFKSV